MSDDAATLAPPDTRVVCAAFDLGEPLDGMTPVAGGLTHRMWRLATTRGVFALKQMTMSWERSSFMAWIERAFTVEQAAIGAGVLAPRPVPNPRSGGCLAEIPGTGEPPETFRAHEWIEGERVPAVVFPPPEAARIGGVLARIHALRLPANVAAGEGLRVEGEAFWAATAERIERSGLTFAWEFRAQLPLLRDIEAYVETARADPTPLLLSHRDSDQKNFMRTPDDGLALVDWDAAGPVNPRHDLANMALTWAGVHLGEPDARVARAFVEGYRAAGGEAFAFLPSDLAEMVSVQEWWFEFNLRRALGAPPFDERQVEAGRQAVPTIMRRDKLRRYLRGIDRWIAILNSA